MTRRRSAAAVLVLAACLPLLSTELWAQRQMTVEDVLSIENLSTIALSPDGRWAAVVIQRSKQDAGFHGRTRLGGDDRGDVWLVATSTAERRRITDGAADGSGFWSPAWSPDGERLAMLSSQGGGGQARLFVWSHGTDKLERLTADGIHVGAAVAANDAQAFGFAWVDAATLLAVIVPADFRPFDFGGDHETQTVAPRAWGKMTPGLEPSVSVLMSGSGAPPRAGTATVALLDIAGQSTPLAEVAVALLSAPQASLAPGGKHLAVLETAPVPPEPGRQMRFDDRDRTRVGVVRVGAERAAPRWLDGIERPSLATVAWSPDGKSLAVLAPGEGSSVDDAVVVLDASSGERRRATPPDWRVRRFFWLDQGRLAVQARARGEEAGSARDDWWWLSPGGEVRNATAALPEPPALIADAAGGALLAVAGGELWLVGSEGAPQNLTASLEPRVRGLAAREGRARSEEILEAVIEAGEPGATSPYRVSHEDGRERIEAVSRPSPGAKVDAHWVSQRVAVFRAKEDSGVFAWAADLSTGRATRLWAINEQLADVAAAERMLIEYRSSDGDPLHGIVLLPHDHEAGRRYPVLVWVYGGDVYRDVGRQRAFTDKFSDNWLNMLPLLARGYAVLLPSIPLGPDGQAGDPLIDIPKGVLPAVDRLIELGIADPDRLAVGGHSYGGYSTFAIVVSSHRFKAAIAIAGTSNLVSHFGTLDARFRYGDTAMEGISHMRLLEGGQGRMAVPPHENLWRYLRNSPLSYVDRVKTPILIVQGDIDFVPLTQGEEFFAGLYRQGSQRASCATLARGTRWSHRPTCGTCGRRSSLGSTSTSRRRGRTSRPSPARDHPDAVAEREP